MALCIQCSQPIFVPRVSSDADLNLDDTSGKVRTGAIPSMEEASLLSEEIAAMELDLKEYVTHLHRLQAAVDAMVAKADQLKRLLSMKQSLMAPIRKLPDDILTLIFELCPFDITGLRKKSPAFMDVCSHWRDVVLSSPTVWSFFSISSSSRMRSFNLQLDRSRACPLNVDVGLKGTDIYYMVGSRTSPFQLFGVLVQHSYRWKSFALRVKQNMDTDQAMRLTQRLRSIHDLSQLKSFTYYSECPLDKEAISNILKAAVNLENLALPCFPHDVESSFSLSNITRLEVLIWNNNADPALTLPLMSGLKNLSLSGR
ncbi:hypothetical protein K435DRAFT_876935 [Dendrothele bispora CBS 962.96]|uniref:Uncharacterized protein n=1 Tax=Dendrothele bispora (strain CBS 962.96) TaxID=1314807 RepID=A0A4S8KQY9_DENBC|nr:hypothetical protein K435DRAFT_876935 [Dendrothele bispora CBS 962.96]